jgi:hypothetical protein
MQPAELGNARVAHPPCHSWASPTPSTAQPPLDQGFRNIFYEPGVVPTSSPWKVSRLRESDSGGCAHVSGLTAHRFVSACSGLSGCSPQSLERVIDSKAALWRCG